MDSTNNSSHDKFSTFVGGPLKSFFLFYFYMMFHSLNKTRMLQKQIPLCPHRYANRLSFSFLLLSPQDQHLHNFFQYCQKTESGAQALGSELVKYLKVSDVFLSNSLFSVWW